MKDITILIPIHKFNPDVDGKYLSEAVASVRENKETYKGGVLNTLVVCPKGVQGKVEPFLEGLDNCSFLTNDGDTDFCSQVNLGAKSAGTDFFSILEYDDEYAPKWFKMVSEYYYSNEDVSLFLPINVHYEEGGKARQYCNEIVWAHEFSKEIGFIDNECLENYYGFNLTGGVFNTKDFLAVGGLKPSIKVAFNHEFLLRLTFKKLKAFVVPKEGYCHLLNREGSLTDEYEKELTDGMVKKWFDIAKCEYSYAEDRKVVPMEATEKLI